MVSVKQVSVAELCESDDDENSQSSACHETEMISSRTRSRMQILDTSDESSNGEKTMTVSPIEQEQEDKSPVKYVDSDSELIIY